MQWRILEFRLQYECKAVLSHVIQCYTWCTSITDASEASLCCITLSLQHCNNDAVMQGLGLGSLHRGKEEASMEIGVMIQAKK